MGDIIVYVRFHDKDKGEELGTVHQRSTSNPDIFSTYLSHIKKMLSTMSPSLLCTVGIVPHELLNKERKEESSPLFTSAELIVRNFDITLPASEDVTNSTFESVSGFQLLTTLMPPGFTPIPWFDGATECNMRPFAIVMAVEDGEKDDNGNARSCGNAK